MSLPGQIQMPSNWHLISIYLSVGSTTFKVSLLSWGFIVSVDRFICLSVHFSIPLLVHQLLYLFLHSFLSFSYFTLFHPPSFPSLGFKPRVAPMKIAIGHLAKQQLWNHQSFCVLSFFVFVNANFKFLSEDFRRPSLSIMQNSSPKSFVDLNWKFSYLRWNSPKPVFKSKFVFLYIPQSTTTAAAACNIYNNNIL